jgi:methylamine dehydrogenase accessory protein MauD
MLEALIVSHLVLWGLVVILGGLVFALTRQIGVLHERVAPVGALSLARGPKAGEAAPVLRVQDLSGGFHEVGAPDAGGLSTLLVFLSPACPVCRSLLPALASLAGSQRYRLRLLLASDGPRREHEVFVRERGLERWPYLISSELGLLYRVAKLPFAVLIDEQGVIRAQGLVNSREHLESLLEAQELGFPSVQRFLEAAREREEVA